MTTPGGDWQAVADDLAVVLRTTMLRNPNLNARDWDRAQLALARYEQAGGAALPDVPGLPDPPQD